MNWVNKILNINLIKPSVKSTILNSRGNIREDFPSDFSDQAVQLIKTVLPFTMTSQERLFALIQSIDYLEANNIQGDIVECGVWRGGSMALAARKLIQLGSENRNLYLFDTFEGMPPPTAADMSAIDQTPAAIQMEKEDKFAGSNVWCYSTLEEVKKNIQSTGYPNDHIFYVKGKVEETLPQPFLEKVALLRLDTDWYESTKHELETMFDLLVSGGILIIDDYGHWSGAKKAVDEFFDSRKMKVLLNRIDYTGRLYIKN